MLEKQLEYIRKITDFIPDTAIVLGSGLGTLSEKVEDRIIIDYSDIEGMPVSTAPTHKGRLVLGHLAGHSVVIMDGRVHLYEGYTPEQVVMPIRLMRMLGAETLILSNACGGINKELEANDLMLITDHISCFVRSPLIGENDDKLGLRFPDMSKVYDRKLMNTFKLTAEENGITLKSGVYVQLTGPQFESPAEIKMLGILGADAVGMSTVIEAIAAKHCGFKVCGISLVSNLACGILDKPLTHEELVESADKKEREFATLITETLRKI